MFIYFSSDQQLVYIYLFHPNPNPKNVPNLNCQYLPQNTRTFFARLKKNVGPYRWVFTVLYILEFFTGNFGKMLLTLRPLSFEYCDHSIHCDQKNTYFVL